MHIHEGPTGRRLKQCQVNKGKPVPRQKDRLRGAANQFVYKTAIFKYRFGLLD